MQIIDMNIGHNFKLSLTLRRLEYATAIARAGSLTRVATRDLMRGHAGHGFGIGLAYSHPLCQNAPDGAPLCLRPIIDAGTKALVLAWRAAEVLPPSADQNKVFERHCDVWNSNRFGPCDPAVKAP